MKACNPYPLVVVYSTEIETFVCTRSNIHTYTRHSLYREGRLIISHLVDQRIGDVAYSQTD